MPLLHMFNSHLQTWSHKGIEKITLPIFCNNGSSLFKTSSTAWLTFTNVTCVCSFASAAITSFIWAHWGAHGAQKWTTTRHLLKTKKVRAFTFKKESCNIKVWYAMPKKKNINKNICKKHHHYPHHIPEKKENQTSKTRNTFYDSHRGVLQCFFRKHSKTQSALLR